MKFIAHRGNILGRIPHMENTQEHLQKALDQGFDVEVDLWVTEEWMDIRTGHDEPLHSLDEKFMELYKNRVWYHAKNFYALDFCLKEGLNAFWQHDDLYSLTTNKKIWHHSTARGPESKWTDLTQSVVMVMGLPELEGLDFFQSPIFNCYAICSPCVANWKVAFLNFRANRCKKQIDYEAVHKGFVTSGMFWEYFYDLSGVWEEDKEKFPELLHKLHANDS